MLTHFFKTLIEAVNKILKYRYIIKKDYRSFKHLRNGIPENITGYKNRPRCKREGLSPNEAFDGIVYDKTAYHERLLAAQNRKLLVNRASCPPCVPLDLEEKIPALAEVQE